MLEEVYTSLAKRYNGDASLTSCYWEEIQAAYGGTGRWYHNMDHLEQMYDELLVEQAQVKDWDTALFALFYHDVVCYAGSSRNEEQSAELARQRLTSLWVPQEMILTCRSMILATKSHVLAEDHDTNLLIDADLSILGQPWDIYHDYCKNIRKEYSMYSDEIYTEGRRVVLNRFLGMRSIYKTATFYNRYEHTARRNIQQELQLLDS